MRQSAEKNIQINSTLFSVSVLCFFCSTMIPLDVLDAFSLPHNAVPLPGGQGNSWRAGDGVLKPHEESYEGISEIVNQLKPNNFRISRHHLTNLGDYTYKGW